MKKGLTEIVFILDRSGSMAGLESDTIGGFNSVIEKQKKEDGEALVSTVLFNHDRKVIHDRIDINEVPALTDKDYYVGGCTALIDAIGFSLKHIKNVHKYIRNEDVPEKTLFVISTDGYENASSVYTSDQVKKMIKESEKHGFEFLFLGANIDSVETAGSFGIREDRVANYMHDSVGIENAYASVDCAISYARCNSSSSDWSKKVREDYNKRNRK